MEQAGDLSTEALCRFMLERNRDTIRVRKPAVATRKLAVIVGAALKLSNEKGFQAMSLRDLAAEAGMSMGGLYSYFDGKTTLLKMILGEVNEVVRRELEAPPETVAADPRRHLRWLIERHVRMTEALLPWFTFAFMEAKNFPQAERRMAVEAEELTESYFRDVLERGMAEGTFSRRTPALLPPLIKPLLQDWYVKRAKYRRRGVGLEDYVAAIEDVVLAACRADPAASGRPPRSLADGSGAACGQSRRPPWGEEGERGKST